MGNRSGQDGDARSAREKRLAEALRANLKRRKMRQREQRKAAPDDDGRRGNRDEESKESG